MLGVGARLLFAIAAVAIALGCDTPETAPRGPLIEAAPDDGVVPLCAVPRVPVMAIRRRVSKGAVAVREAAPAIPPAIRCPHGLEFGFLVES